MTIKTLVVDNNPVLLKAIAIILEQEGCEVQTATNGLQALDLLKNYTPDIVFTDLVMPLVGGDQLCKIIRNTEGLEDVFLVVVSAIILEDLDQILADGYYDICIAKGNLREIRSHVQEALAEFRKRGTAIGGNVNNFAARIPNGLQPSLVTSELLSEKKHLTRILANLHEGIIELSRRGIMVSLNSAATRILDCREEDVIGLSFAEFDWGAHTGNISQWVAEDLVGGGMSSLEITEESPLRVGDNIVVASLIPVCEGGDVFALCIFRDITRQYLAEEHERELDNAIKLIKKMDALSCMAGGIAHDFNNLLTVICGNLDIVSMSRSTRDEEGNRKLVEHARNAAYLAVDLTRKISCFSPFGIISRKDVQLESLVQGTITRYFAENPGQYNILLSSHNAIVNIDPDQIATALENVLQNAQEAGGGKEILIETGDEEFDSPMIIAGQYVPAGKYARVSVKDSGAGIERENMLKIFDPYYSTKERGALKGMGLGLTVVYATLRNHGGYVVVESALNEGTSVSFFLPAYASADPGWLHGSKQQTPRQHILLVEHDSQLQDVGLVMLKYLGHQVSIAGSLKEALAFLADNREKDTPVDVVLYDYVKEDQVEPETICPSFLDLDNNLRIVVTGGGTMEPVMQNSRAYGFANVLPKPFTMDSMKHVLKTLAE